MSPDCCDTGRNGDRELTPIDTRQCLEGTKTILLIIQLTTTVQCYKHLNNIDFEGNVGSCDML